MALHSDASPPVGARARAHLDVSATPPRVLGFWAAVSIVMGNMIGSGVFLLPASLAAYRGLSLAGWAVSAGGAVMLALVFARLARQLPATGGLYAYTRAAFGDFAGFFVAWGYWLSTVGTLAALAVAFVGYLDPFIPVDRARARRGGGAGHRHRLAGHWRQHRRRWAGGPRADRHHGAEAASAGCCRHRGPVLFSGRRVQHAVHGNNADGHATSHGRHADLVGLSWSRDGDDPGWQRSRSGPDDSPGDDCGDRRHGHHLHRIHDRGDESGRTGRAGDVHRAVCRRRRATVGRTPEDRSSRPARPSRVSAR